MTSHFQFVLQILAGPAGTAWVCMYCALVLVRMLQGKDGSVQLGVAYQLLCASVGRRPHRGGHATAAVSGTTGQRACGWVRPRRSGRCARSAETACLLCLSDQFSPPPVSGSRTMICGLHFCDVMFLCLPGERRYAFTR